MRRVPSRALAAALLLLPLCVTAAGSVDGRVTLGGPKPAKPAALDTSSDPACGGVHLLDASILLGGKDTKGLANVVVRVKGPRPEAAPTAPVKVEQRGCSYLPRVQGAVLGQPLEVVNADATLHNVHAYSAAKGLFNVAQPPGSPAVIKPSPSAPGPVRLTCDVHRWMVAYVVYGESPYVTLTDKDGRFRLDGLPAGTWEVEFWHEVYGTQTLPLVVKDGAQLHLPLVYTPH
jgi:plastocyanin